MTAPSQSEIKNNSLNAFRRQMKYTQLIVIVVSFPIKMCCNIKSARKMYLTTSAEICSKTATSTRMLRDSLST